MRILTAISAIGLVVAGTNAATLSAQTGRRGNSAPPAQSDRFGQIDVNRDNRVSRSEWDGSPVTFRRLDTNSDGFLTRQEAAGTDLVEPIGGGTGGQGGQGGQSDLRQTVAINARQAWTDTGITVRSGDLLSVGATGTINVTRNGDASDPNGIPEKQTPFRAPVRRAPIGTLVGRIGNDEPFVVGSRHESRVASSGRLFLGINDDNVSDNSGEFRVFIALNGAALGGAPADRPIGGGKLPNTALDGTLDVSARQSWTDTGIEVRAGDLLSVRASGKVFWSDRPDTDAGPNGRPPLTTTERAPIPFGTMGQLIGRIGDGAPFVIGARLDDLRLTANGRLFLGINDDNLRDNSGEFRAVVGVTRR